MLERLKTKLKCQKAALIVQMELEDLKINQKEICTSDNQITKAFKQTLLTNLHVC